MVVENPEGSTITFSPFPEHTSGNTTGIAAVVVILIGIGPYHILYREPGIGEI